MSTELSNSNLAFLDNRVSKHRTIIQDRVSNIASMNQVGLTETDNNDSHHGKADLRP